jgi:hypothetical protein
MSGGDRSSSSSLMLAIDFDAVALAFVKCAGMYTTKDSATNSSMNWLTSPYAVDTHSSPSSSSLALIDHGDHGQESGVNGGEGSDTAEPVLLYIVENLICVLHNMNGVASVEERSCWAIDLDRCVGIAERNFPPHSFMKQVGRWIRDQMNYETL